MTGKTPKYASYQEYVIKDGKLVAEFEEMYQDHGDPWEQSTRELGASEKVIGLHLLKKYQAKRVLEVGCGFGHYTQQICSLGIEAMGIDISPTAISKAQRRHPDCCFEVGELMDLDIYRDFQPDCIVLAEITWYILDELDEFLIFFRAELPSTRLLHMLTVYPAGVQKYGADKFTDLPGILAYFGAEYLEWGVVTSADMGGCSRTFFLGQFTRQGQI